MSVETPWMTTTEARLYARCGRRQLLAALQTGQLVGTQRTVPNGTWRIHRDDLEAWLRAPHGASPRCAPRARLV